MPKALALYSGGLDSTLAILVILKQGIEVTAVQFITDFGCKISSKSLRAEVSEKFGFEVRENYISDKFLDIVKNPKFGHGKNMNPCMDCKILMLKEAKKFMEQEGADFIITGEVLWQRPMSQRRDTFPRIDKEAGLDGYILRPLSAKLLKPTVPEQTGIVDREKLYGFSGRTRKPQMALAKEFGLSEYPQPAGGCLLTDPIYSFRFKELLSQNPSPSLKDIKLLRLGRHFRISQDCKIIVGRNEKENDAIQLLAGDKDYLLNVEGYGSPITIIQGSASDDVLQLAASICARYSDAKKLDSIEVAISKGDRTFRIQTKAATDELVMKYRIQPAKAQD
jgi:tRNA U34 2-thiouridine synthase MnmA/TrmU